MHSTLGLPVLELWGLRILWIIQILEFVILALIIKNRTNGYRWWKYPLIGAHFIVFMDVTITLLMDYGIIPSVTQELFAVLQVYSLILTFFVFLVIEFFKLRHLLRTKKWTL